MGTPLNRFQVFSSVPMSIRNACLICSARAANLRFSSTLTNYCFYEILTTCSDGDYDLVCKVSNR